jgi:hypothetical protein
VSQSNSIFAFLALAFIVFITMRGELPVYTGFLLGPTNGGTGATPADTGNVDVGSLVNDGLKLAAMFA